MKFTGLFTIKNLICRCVLLLSIILASCDKEACIISQTETTSAEETNYQDESFGYDSVSVFISGAVNVANNKWIASYWKNDSLVILETEHSLARDITVFDNRIVIGGEYSGHPCFWNNHKLTILDSVRQGQVRAIVFLNSEMYLVGQIYQNESTPRAFLWKNGVMKILSDSNGYASDVAVSGKDVYISGMDAEKPCYWKNEVKTILSKQFGHGYGIEVRGSDVYVAGEYRPTNGGYYIVGYWKNTKFISPGQNATYIWNLGVNKDQVSLIGNQVFVDKSAYDRAVQIRGMERIELTTSDNRSSTAIDIAYNGSDEYILGSINAGTTNKPYTNVCYWLNNRRYDISCNLPAISMAIYLKPEDKR